MSASGADLHVPLRLPRKVLWLEPPRPVRPPVFLPAAWVGSLLAGFVALAYSSQSGSLVPVLLGALVIACLCSPLWIATALHRRRVTRILRHGIPTPAEILAVGEPGSGAFETGRRVTFRFKDASGGWIEGYTDSRQLARPVEVGPTTALLNPWTPEQALVPSLHPVSLGESHSEQSLPPAPRAVELLSGPPSYRPGLWAFGGVAVSLGIAVYGVTAGVGEFVLAGICGVAAAGLLTGGGLVRRKLLGARFERVAKWGRRARLRVREVQPLRDGVRLAKVRFTEPALPKSTEVLLAVGPNWTPPDGELDVLVAPGWPGVGKDAAFPLVLIAGDDHLRLPEAPSRPLLAPPPTQAAPAPSGGQALSLWDRSYPLDGVQPSGRRIEVEEEVLCWRDYSGEDVVLNGADVFHLDVTYWPAEEEQHEVAVTLRQGAVRLGVRVALPIACVRPDVGRKQSADRWVHLDDFRVLWNWIRYHRQVAGADADHLSVSLPG